METPGKFSADYLYNVCAVQVDQVMVRTWTSFVM